MTFVSLQKQQKPPDWVFGKRFSDDAVMLYNFTNTRRLICLPGLISQSNITFTPGRPKDSLLIVFSTDTMVAGFRHFKNIDWLLLRRDNSFGIGVGRGGGGGEGGE